MNLVDVEYEPNSQKAVQTIGHSIEAWLKVDGSNSLVIWLCRHLLRVSNAGLQKHLVPVLCDVLDRANPHLLDRSCILGQLIKCIKSPETSHLILGHVPLMSVDGKIYNIIIFNQL